MENPVAGILTLSEADLLTQPYELGIPASECASWLAVTLNDSRTLLGPLDNTALSRALDRLFAGSVVDIAYLVRDSAMPLATRIEALRSVATLYRDVLDHRLGDSLQSTGEAPASSLHQTVFMIWDVSPLTWWPPSEHAGAASRCLAETFGVVLRECRSPACLESVLHGLGHLFTSNAAAVGDVIGEWHRGEPGVSETLFEYSELASRGIV